MTKERSSIHIFVVVGGVVKHSWWVCLSTLGIRFTLALMKIKKGA